VVQIYTNEVAVARGMILTMGNILFLSLFGKPIKQDENAPC
jgi:hypothetical protein